MRAHARYLSYVVRHKWFVLLAGLKTGAPLWRLLIHDWSKFTPGEWFPYVAYFYGPKEPPAHVLYVPNGRPNREANRRDWLAERQARFDAAWLHHQHANPHHWQHWMLREDSGAVKLLPMPDHFVREMVADWMGAGRAITGQWEAGAWYTKNRDVIQLDQQTRIGVERLLGLHAGLTCIWGCNGGSPTYCGDVLRGCEAHCAQFFRGDDGYREDVAAASVVLAVDPVSGTRADSWSIPPASASAITPPIPVAANPQEDETDAR